jgi:hypothetical protein
MAVIQKEKQDKKDNPKTIHKCTECHLPIKEGDEYRCNKRGDIFCQDCSNLLPGGIVLTTHIAKRYSR